MKQIIDFLEESNIDYRENESMKMHTTFRIGGNAALFIIPDSEEKLQKLICFLNSVDIKPIIVGNGSNLLVKDEGIDNVVIHPCGDLDFVRSIDETTIESGAGTSLASVCKYALSKGLTGLEFAYGIPGSIGGAVYMNAGAYGGQMSDVVKCVKHIEKDGKIGLVDAKDLAFGYRTSVYGTNEAVITSVTIKLQKGNSEEISSKMNELMQRRIDKQPLSYPSAGSVFKRPEGYFAGALIEQSGLKGKKIGGAQVSEKHAGFIVNAGDATCKDVLDLVDLCCKTVKEKFGVTLEREIKLI